MSVYELPTLMSYSSFLHNRGKPIRVVRVVVVNVAGLVHIPRVIRIVAVSGPQPDILSISLRPISVLIRFLPFSNKVPCF